MLRAGGGRRMIKPLRPIHRRVRLEGSDHIDLLQKAGVLASTRVQPSFYSGAPKLAAGDRLYLVCVIRMR